MSLRAPGLHARPEGRRRTTGCLEHLALALVAYVPQLWSQPGVLDADVKAYVYLDPGRFVRQSASMWDPTVGLGTVTHEQIGYLWPLGPFFWVVHTLGIPLWVGQRLWIGTLLFGAGAGMLFLCRTVGLDGPGRPVAAFAYMLSPYFLQDAGRISTLLLPWAGLGWMLGLVMRSVRTGGWRHPAIFALIWLTISGNNASGPIYAVVAPALWLVYAVVISKEHTLRQAWAGAWKVAVLTAAVSLWWAWSLFIEGHYGLNILGYTESIAAVAKTSTAFEILRGLGYWFFYGADASGPWAATLTGFTQDLWLIVVTFAIPILALAAAGLVRWRHRSYFLFLIVVGMTLAVGSHPYSAPSAVGSLIKAFMTKTSVGLALRSSDRATPMVLLGLTVLLGAGVTALARRRRTAGLVACVVVLAGVAAANPAAWNGSTVLDRYTIPTPLPSYTTQAAKALDASSPRTRVLAIPGDNTAVYRYGDTVDPVWPGLLTRPFVTGEQSPLGSLPSYDLLYGLDVPLQTGTANPAALAPTARLMSAGDVLVQNDIAYWLYQRPSPQQSWPALGLPQAGLGTPVGFGKPVPDVPKVPVVTETLLAGNPKTPWPSPLDVVPVADPRPIVRGESTHGAVVVGGDGVGLVQAAGLGLLDTDAPVLYAGTLDTEPSARKVTLAGGATLVLTDTNRKENFLWNVASDNEGVTLSTKAPQPTDSLNIFPEAPASAQSTADNTGVASVSSLPDTVDHPPVQAIDGMVDTAWETNIGSPPLGKWWQVTTTHPVTADRITVVQAQPGDYQYQRWITRATLSFDKGSPVSVALGRASHTSPGQTISFSPRTFSTLRITIDDTNLSSAASAVKNAASPVGLAEVGVGGVRAQQVVAMPTDLLHAAGASSVSDPLAVIMTRERGTTQADQEPVLDRSFSLPTKRTFSLAGSASISTKAPDSTVDDLVGRGAAGAGPVASSSGRLPGDALATASSALDGNPSTMWTTGLGTPNQLGAWIQVDLPRPVTFDHLDLQVAADGYHSVPTALRVQACDAPASDGRCPAGGAQEADVSLPAVRDGRSRGDTAGVPVTFVPVTGRYLTFTVTGVRLEKTKANVPISLPIGIAELGIPGVQVRAPATSVSSACRSDLVTVDGRPVSVAMTGSTQDALEGKDLPLRLCGPDAAGLALGPGRHVVTTADGADTGLDVDQLALASAAGGGAAEIGASGPTLSAPSPGPAPTVHVVSYQTTEIRLRITGATKPFWLVLGQSINTGWQATVDGTGRSLGRSGLIDGFANGWLVDPTASATMSVTLRWTPQSTQNLMLVVSAAAVVLCGALALWPRRRRARADRPAPALEGAVPGLRSPFGDTVASSLRLAIPVGLVCGLVSAVLVPPANFPVVFVGVGGVVVLALLLPPARAILGLGAVALTAGAVVYIVAEQATGHFGANGGWPSQFEGANVLVWVAVLLLVADAVVELVRRRRS